MSYMLLIILVILNLAWFAGVFAQGIAVYLVWRYNKEVIANLANHINTEVDMLAAMGKTIGDYMLVKIKPTEEEIIELRKTFDNADKRHMEEKKPKLYRCVCYCDYTEYETNENVKGNYEADLTREQMLYLLHNDPLLVHIEVPELKLRIDHM